MVDGQVEFGLAQDRAKDYFKFMNRIYTDGLMSQDFFSSTNADLGSQSRLDFGLGLNSLVSTAANKTSDIMMNVSDDAYLLTNYGVEGVTYTLDENGKPHYTDLIINNPDGLSYFFASYVYATNAASSFFPFLNDMSRTFFDFTDNQWQVYNAQDAAINAGPGYFAYR